MALIPCPQKCGGNLATVRTGGSTKTSAAGACSRCGTTARAAASGGGGLTAFVADAPDADLEPEPEASTPAMLDLGRITPGVLEVDGTTFRFHLGGAVCSAFAVLDDDSAVHVTVIDPRRPWAGSLQVTATDPDGRPDHALTARWQAALEAELTIDADAAAIERYAPIGAGPDIWQEAVAGTGNADDDGFLRQHRHLAARALAGLPTPTDLYERAVHDTVRSAARAERLGGHNPRHFETLAARVTYAVAGTIEEQGPFALALEPAVVASDPRATAILSRFDTMLRRDTERWADTRGVARSGITDEGARDCIVEVVSPLLARAGQLTDDQYRVAYQLTRDHASRLTLADVLETASRAERPLTDTQLATLASLDGDDAGRLYDIATALA